MNSEVCDFTDKPTGEVRKVCWGLRERYDDEEGPVEALVLHEVSDEGDGLDRFP